MIAVVSSVLPFPDRAVEASALPFVVSLDDSDSPRDVVDALALGPFTTGRQPWACSVYLDRVRRSAPLMPAGGRVVRAVHEDSLSVRLVEGDGWTLKVLHYRNGGADVQVTAVSAALAKQVLDETTRGAAKAPVAAGVRVGFWHYADRPIRRSRRVGAEKWADISRNYASGTRAAVDAVMRLGPDDLTGRLLLLHGPPGTGKTTALRTLAHEWRAWCQFDTVLDPERLFNHPGYLMSVAVGEDSDDDDDNKRRWRLLLLEDCDELISGQARQSSGQALSRLLNLSDGLLGQGRDILLAITTNEDLSTLHPAVVRPGRCLAQIEVGRLPYAEAVSWLGTAAGVGAGGATLAELVALRSGQPPVTYREPAPPAGCYL